MNYLDTSALIKRFVRQYASACRQFESDWRAYIRRFDAIHVTSALSLKSALGEEITFAAADERLLRAAEAEGLRALNVETAPAP